MRVLPEPERHADRVRRGAEERHCAVDASAHRDGDAAGRGLGREDLSERCRERLDRERVAAGRRRLEQRQACERSLEAVTVRVDDAVAVDAQPHRAPLAGARRVPETSTGHELRLDDAAIAPSSAERSADKCSTLPMMPRPPGNLALPGGCRAGRRQRLSPTPAPFTCLLVHVWAEATYRVERRSSYSVASVAKRHSISRRPLLESRGTSRERLRHLELPAALDERVVDHLGQHQRVAPPEHELRAAREHGVRDAERLGREHETAGRPLRVARRPARPANAAFHPDGATALVSAARDSSDCRSRAASASAEQSSATAPRKTSRCANGYVTPGSVADEVRWTVRREVQALLPRCPKTPATTPQGIPEIPAVSAIEDPRTAGHESCRLR